MVDITTSLFERKVKALIPASLKSMAVNIVCNALFGYLIKASGLRFNFFGGVYDYSLVDNRTACRIFFGFWESAEIRFSKRFAENHTIVELGSSIGVTYGVLSKVYPNSKYICVEASPRNFFKLKKLVNFIGKKDNLTLINKAVCYSGESQVRFNETTISGSKIAEPFEDTSISVPATTLTEILFKNEVEGDYTLITDIEGAEADIFFKDIESLKNCTKIICELEETEVYSVDEQVSQLKQVGFHLQEQYGNVFFMRKS